MGERDIVHRLVAGQAELDRMKGETNWVTQIIRDLVKLPIQEWCRSKNGERFPSLESNSCLWKFCMDYDSMSNRWFVAGLECYRKSPGELVFDLYRGSILVNIRFVHENLNTLVEGLVTIFPWLDAKLKPYLEASNQAN